LLTLAWPWHERFGPYFVEPVICGLSGPDNKPFIAAMDLIGAPLLAKDSVVAGTCSEALYGMTESLWKPDLVRPCLLPSAR
jgi:20S proteasome subunit beta 3